MVAIDFSDYSLAAAEYAAKLAEDTGAALLFTNVYNQRDIEMMNNVATRVPEFSIKNYVDENILERKIRLQDSINKIDRSGFPIEIHVRIGVPFDALLQEIEEKKPGLLVMGAKGRSNVVDMILGSCAQKMFRHCPIPLLSIRHK